MEIKIPELPATQMNQMKLRQARHFLHENNLLGSYTLVWEDPVTRVNLGLRFDRTERGQGDYYRDPYPLYAILSSSDISKIPFLKIPITLEQVSDLLHQIDKQIV